MNKRENSDTWIAKSLFIRKTIFKQQIVQTTIRFINTKEFNVAKESRTQQIFPEKQGYEHLAAYLQKNNCVQSFCAVFL